MIISDLRYRAERLDEVAERTELDDQNFPLSRCRSIARAPPAGQSFDIDVMRQILECPEKPGVDGQLGRAHAGEKRLNQPACGGEDGSFAKLSNNFAGFMELGRRDKAPPAGTPANERPPCQMGKANIGFAFGLLCQPVYVGSNDIPAIPFEPGLVPREKRMKRSPRGKDVRIEASRQRACHRPPRTKAPAEPCPLDARSESSSSSLPV